MCAVLALALFAGSALADETYDFSFTPTTDDVGTLIEAFNLSFTVPTFVTSGQTPSFTPVTMTDGTNSATLTTALASTDGSISYQTAGFYTGSKLDETFGSVTLAISSPSAVPEPSGIFLTPVLLAAMWVVRRRTSRA